MHAARNFIDRNVVVKNKLNKFKHKRELHIIATHYGLSTIKINVIPARCKVAVINNSDIRSSIKPS